MNRSLQTKQETKSELLIWLAVQPPKEINTFNIFLKLKLVKNWFGYLNGLEQGLEWMRNKLNCLSTSGRISSRIILFVRCTNDKINSHRISKSYLIFESRWQRHARYTKRKRIHTVYIPMYIYIQSIRIPNIEKTKTNIEHVGDS